MKSLALLLAMLVVSCASNQALVRSGMRAALVAETTIPHALSFEATVVGGLSGIERGADGTWYLISDDRSARAPARFYTATIDITPGSDAAAGSVAVRFTGVVQLRDRSGVAYARGAVDPEGIRYDPAEGTLWWSSEGDEAQMIDPSVREMLRDGSFRREIPMPASLRMDTSRAIGPRANGVFEGIALGADRREIIVSLEEALKQDGPGVTREATGPVRITFFDRESGRMTRQIAYAPEHAPQSAIDTVVAGNGVVEVLALDTDRLLVLERAYTPGLGNTVRLFESDIAGAPDVAELASLAGGSYAARKRLVVDFAELGLARIDNIEGMSWGPALPDGRRTLVFVSDDNFSPRQVTQLVVVALEL